MLKQYLKETLLYTIAEITAVLALVSYDDINLTFIYLGVTIALILLQSTINKKRVIKE